MRSTKIKRIQKFRIYPNKRQEILINKTFNCARFIYNHILAEKIEYFENTKKIIYPNLKDYIKQYEWLKEADIIALNCECREVNQKFLNFVKRQRNNHLSFKTKKRRHCRYTTKVQPKGIQIKNKYIKLPKMGWVKFEEYRKITKKFAGKVFIITSIRKVNIYKNTMK